MPTQAGPSDTSRLEGALRESEERFRATFDQAAVGIAHVTPDGRWLRVNQRLMDILGYSAAELEARTLLEITHPDDVDREQALVHRLMRGELPWFSLEKRYIRADGSVVWVDRTVSAVTAPDGSIKYMISVVQDATERRLAQQRALAQSAVSRALAQSGVGFEDMTRVLKVICELLDWQIGVYWVVDPASNVLRVNSVWRTSADSAAAFEEGTRSLTMAPGVGLPGRVWESGIPAWIPDVSVDRTLLRAPLYASTGLRGALAFPLRGPGEILGVMEFFTSEVRAVDDALLHTAGALGNQLGQYLERRRAEATVHQSEIRHAAILASALDCIVTIDHHGRITEFNPAAERTFGYTREQAIGQNMSELLVPPSLREGHRQGMARYLATGQKRVIDQRIEITAMRSDKTEFPVELAITRLPVEGPAMFTGYMRDLTERKRAEANH